MLQEVVGSNFDLNHYHTANYHTIFYKALPQALQRLQQDSSPAAQIRASVTYNMIVEGMLAETGYHAYFTVLERLDMMPGTRRGITLLKQDESRHIAYGIYLISRLLAADKGLWEVVEATMDELFMPALGVVGDAFAQYDTVPFGLIESDFIDYAMNQSQKRIARLERARSQSLEEIHQTTNQIIDENDG
jgi:ribonucleoside-diphosphate reductase beta chain